MWTPAAVAWRSSKADAVTKRTVPSDHRGRFFRSPGTVLSVTGQADAGRGEGLRSAQVSLGITGSMLIGAIPGAFIGAQIPSRAPGGIIRRALAILLMPSA